MNDDDLRARFGELRDQERRAMPPFAVTFAATVQRPRRRSRLVPAVVMLLLVVLVAGVLLRPDRPREFTAADRAAARRLAAWQAPTDALLRTTPGRELLVSLPDIPSSDLPKGVPR